MRAWQWVMVGLLLPTMVWAHGGRTNAQGCHNDRKHGGYHCHGGVVATPSVPLRRQNPPASPPVSVPLRRQSPSASPPVEVSPGSSGLPCNSAFPNSMTIEEQLKELDQCYSDALLRLEEYQRRRAELLEQQRILGIPPTAPPAEAPPVPALLAPALLIPEKLQALKRQRENREISPEEYYEKRSEILEEGR